MVAARLNTEVTKHRFAGLRAIAGFTFTDDSGHTFDAGWFGNPRNTSWKAGPDTQPWRRALAVAVMKERFGTFEET